MVSILSQLVTIISVAIAIQTIVIAQDVQEYEDYEENSVSSLGKFMDYLKTNIRKQLPSSSDSSESLRVPEDALDFENAYDEDRQSRSYDSHLHDMQEHFCMMVTRQEILSNNNFEYRPSILEEKYCQPVIGVPDHNQKGLCYVRGRGCQTVTQEVSFFKRQRHTGHCWKPEVRNVSQGCRCYFERENLRGKSYVG